MAKQSGPTYEQIMTELHQKVYRPVYLLMGEEDYYIDCIADYIDANVLAEDEREFNYTLLYGKDTSCDQIIMAAKRYPVMSRYQVIMVKEAQNISNWVNLAVYLNRPLESSIIVLCYKHKVLDRRTKVAAEIAKKGVLFESRRKYDNEIPGWIINHCRTLNIETEPKAANLLAEFLGTDLTRIVNEINKLRILLEQQHSNRIDCNIVEKNIGISKEYNNFELVNAIAARDTLKTFRIIEHFAKDPKNNPLVVTVSTMFNFFANLMLYLSLPDKSDMNIAAELKINPYFVRDYHNAARKYDSRQVLNAIGIIRKLDAQSKGMGTNSADERDLLREAVFKIMQCPPRGH